VAAPPRLRFSELWRRLGASGFADETFGRLAAAYGQPGRAYHTFDHILDCLARFDEAHAPPDRRDPVEAAIWFHDVVYDPHRADNEDRSAEWAERALSAAHAPVRVVEHIEQLIRMTSHSAPVTDPEGSLLCDVDLSILGRDEAEFDRYERRIREEYTWVPEPLYRTGRARILSEFLERDRIYQTDHFHDRYEAPARANLRRALARLEA
jgi:predicted metal-dependent HD superfamily phosphohydrolase